MRDQHDRRPLRWLRRRAWISAAVAVAAICLFVAARTAAAQSAADTLRGFVGQVLQGQNLSQVVQGWLTDKLTQVLTKSSGAMAGDKRLANNGRGLALTAEEQAKANQASVLFNQTLMTAPDQTPSVDIFQSGTAAGQADLRRLQQAAKRYGGSANLTPSQQAEVRQALQPFVLAYLVKKGQDEGVGAVVVPPHSVASYSFAGYCSDPHLGAPRAGEQFQLVSTDTLYPPELQPALRGLLRIGAQQGRGHDGTIQGLIWTLRRTASGESMGQSLTLSPEQQRVLTEADPNAVSALQGYYTKAQGQRLMQDAIRSGVQRLTNSMGVNRALSSISNSQALSEVQTLTAQVQNTPVPGGVQGQNAAYTLLNDQVTALATTQTGGLATVNVDLANSGDMPTVFYPGTCLAESTRPAQRLAMQMQSGSTIGALSSGLPDRSMISAAVWNNESGKMEASSLVERSTIRLIPGQNPYLQKTQVQLAVGLCLEPAGWIICGVGSTAIILSSPQIQAMISNEVRSLSCSCSNGNTVTSTPPPDPDHERRCLAEQLALQEARGKTTKEFATENEIRDLPRLIAQYGQGSWAKVTYRISSSAGPIEVHFYRNRTTGKEEEFKVKDSKCGFE